MGDILQNRCLYIKFATDDSGDGHIKTSPTLRY